MKVVLLALTLLGLTFPLVAQEGSVPAIDFLRDRTGELGVTATDIAELRITDQYRSPSGVEHVYVGQYLNGTPVWNAQAAVHYRDEKAVHYTSRFQARLRERANLTVPSLTAEQAFRASRPLPSVRLEASELNYYPLPDESAIRLAWTLEVENTEDGMHHLAMIDAVDGRTLMTAKLTLSCNFDALPEGGAAGTKKPEKHEAFLSPVVVDDGAMYNVFPFGLDSPNDGQRQLVFEPADSVASPFGWHDTNGEPGPEYTITRGNNTHAYRDADTIPNRPDPGFEADGGEDLDFDFAFTPPQRPDSILPASLVQLFYTVNKLHDWSYHHGFDEAAGNFQAKNYSGVGRGRDAVNAEAQDDSGTNNANFLTRRDGIPGRMQMYFWRSNNSFFSITGPEGLAGDLRSGTAAFGKQITRNDTIRGELAIGFDGSNTPGTGCEALVNPEEVAGKIAMITRGGCTFQQKAFNAEQAGAIGVVICNVNDDVLNMAGAGEPNDIPVTIPAILIRDLDCRLIQQRLTDGITVEAEFRDNDATPLDGAFDNGVVAHEYAHGISNRLIGGPNRADCLINEEQMGEGWSDFFLLASTPQTATENPNGTEPRGVGIYSTGGDADARGFRSQFYSTDPAVNTLTYDNIILAAVPHGVGETWAAALWDLYWRMVDAYGFDEDLINGTGGNNAAVRLVIEGMKYTTCNPGMVDGRDGLLAADLIENGGANQCMIWEVFQRRGLGLSADQGSSGRSDDNQEAFDIVPECVATAKVIKSANTDVINPGEPITYTLTVRNDKTEAITGINVTDELPAGLTVNTSSISADAPFDLEADRVVFELDTLSAGELVTIAYTVDTDPQLSSSRLFFDGAEAETDSLTAVSAVGEFAWIRTDTTPYSGTQAWYVLNRPSEQDQVLRLADPIEVTGPNPVLRFFTKYQTEPAYDAGIVQVSTDGEEWENVDSSFLRFGYRGFLSPIAAAALQGTPTFWGDTKESYREAIIDLSDYRDERIFVRWRFVSDNANGERGWWVDNIELLSDIQYYDGLATLTTAEGDRDSSRLGELGVVVNNQEVVSGLANSLPNNASVTVFPNPATTMLTVRLTAATTSPAQLQVYGIEGRLLQSREVSLHTGLNKLELPVAQLPAGTYTLKLIEPAAATTRKVTVVR